MHRHDGELERCRPRGEDASSARGENHLQVLAPRGRDVVLAGMPGALDDLAGEQVQVAADDVAELPIAQPQTNELDEKGFGGDGALDLGAGLELPDQRSETEQALSDELDSVHDVDADSIAFEV